MRLSQIKIPALRIGKSPAGEKKRVAGMNTRTQAQISILWALKNVVTSASIPDRSIFSPKSI